MIEALRRSTIITLAVLTFLMVTHPAQADRAQDVRDEIARLNHEWNGASCVIRLPLEVRKKPNREGWYRSWWMIKTAGPDKDSGFSYQFRVSDLDRIRRFLDGRVVRPGTRFIADERGFEDPQRGKGLYLDLHFADAPARTRWIFTTKSMSTDSKVTLKQLRFIESYVRIQAHKVSFASEQLVEVESPSPEPVATPEPIRTSSTRPQENPAPVVFKPRIRLLATAVEPPQVLQGSTLRLVLSYEVTGLPPSTNFEVTEERQLVRGQDALASFSNQVARTVGTFTSELPIDIPATAEPGLYALQASVAVAGISDQGGAIFQVVAADSGNLP